MNQLNEILVIITTSGVGAFFGAGAYLYTEDDDDFRWRKVFGSIFINATLGLAGILPAFYLIKSPDLLVLSAAAVFFPFVTFFVVFPLLKNEKVQVLLPQLLYKIIAAKLHLKKNKTGVDSEDTGEFIINGNGITQAELKAALELIKKGKDNN